MRVALFTICICYYGSYLLYGLAILNHHIYGGGLYFVFCELSECLVPNLPYNKKLVLEFLSNNISSNIEYNLQIYRLLIWAEWPYIIMVLSNEIAQSRHQAITNYRGLCNKVAQSMRYVVDSTASEFQTFQTNLFVLLVHHINTIVYTIIDYALWLMTMLLILRHSLYI